VRICRRDESGGEKEASSGHRHLRIKGARLVHLIEIRMPVIVQISVIRHSSIVSTSLLSAQFFFAGIVAVELYFGWQIGL
jgi:hypothetical protein